MTKNDIIKKLERDGGEKLNGYADRTVPILQDLNNGRSFGLSSYDVENCRNKIAVVLKEEIDIICKKSCKLYSKYIDVEDLCSTASTKILSNINKFDPEKGTFSTFIKDYIRASIRESFENSNSTTNYEYERHKIINNKAKELASIMDRKPELVRDEDIAFALKNDGISLKSVKKYRNIAINKNAIRIDDDNSNLTNRIADKDAYKITYVDDLEDSFNSMLRSFDDIDLLLFLIMYDDTYNYSREDVMNTDLYRMMYSRLHPTSKKACQDNKPVYEKHVTHINSELARYGKGIARLYTIEEFNECLMHFIEKTRCDIVDYLNNKYY